MELENLAQDWSESCNFHEADSDVYPQFQNIGQVFASGGRFKPTFSEILPAFAWARDHYDYENDTCKGFCDDYKQTYSQQMEELAIKWVSRCKFEHPNPTTDPDYKGIGQNLALAGTYTPNMTRMAQGWYDEIKNYKYADNSCKGVCGHYTQMVWATSVGLGCAMKQCDDIKPEWKMPVYLMACQYQPA
ncbi:unnamed protein product [Mesocestoides corti]|uniref:SCP domain-containing protein n=1 Tax=Mesocestoides corti TaxID=53468 RepID=A0A158QVX5_MESCO|nr:unnamed protein product [Mesocestoides corti]